MRFENFRTMQNCIIQSRTKQGLTIFEVFSKILIAPLVQATALHFEKASIKWQKFA